MKRVSENQNIRGQDIRSTGYQEKGDVGNFGDRLIAVASGRRNEEH
jgi:hypothetical protein